MRTALLGLIAIAIAAAQDQTGRIEGVVVDAVSHQPVKKAVVSILYTGIPRAGGDGGRTQNQDQPAATTDASGKFAFDNLPTGPYQVIAMHQNYPQARMGGVRKSVQVTADDNASNVTVEMVPGAAVSGHIVDEDGDPVNGCMVQVHPAKNFSQGVPMRRVPMAGEDGSYRLYSIPPGKYTITAQCMTRIFQPRPLSEGPDPPPTSAYPLQFYPAATDLKSAQVVELSPGAEKSGVDFQMRPVSVTYIRGRLTAGSADWRGRSDLQIQLQALGPQGADRYIGRGTQINAKDGSFEIDQVFPGSYRIVAFTQNFLARAGQPQADDRIGAIMRVDVANKPIEVTLPLQRAADISGTIQIEHANSATKQITPSQIHIQLTSEAQLGGRPAVGQPNDDGSFIIKSVLPGEWRVRVQGPPVFIKSATLGGDDVTNRPLDLTTGSASPLRIVVSTNTATIRGTAPGGQMVYAAPIDGDDPFLGFRGAPVDSNGQFTLQGLAPGKYRVGAVDMGSPMPEEGGREMTVAEGETATVDVKPETKP